MQPQASAGAGPDWKAWAGEIIFGDGQMRPVTHA
jgi:hypothetical protein